MEDTRFACSLTLSQCDDQICNYLYIDWNGYCKFPDFTLPKLGIIPDFVL